MPRPTSDVQAFEAHATDADLDDLRARLAAARPPEAETVHRAAPDPRRWDQGVPLADLVDVVNYWRTGYKWRSFEERLNRETRDFWRHRAAYAKQQATRPQTIGYSLVDSP
ncbi:epoxide hydrolase N-terminal domain-containing protein, partial [Streptomyces tubercidicus]